MSEPLELELQAVVLGIAHAPNCLLSHLSSSAATVKRENSKAMLALYDFKVTSFTLHAAIQFEDSDRASVCVCVCV